MVMDLMNRRTLILVYKKKGFQLNFKDRSGGLEQNFGHKDCLR